MFQNGVSIVIQNFVVIVSTGVTFFEGTSFFGDSTSSESLEELLLLLVVVESISTSDPSTIDGYDESNSPIGDSQVESSNPIGDSSQRTIAQINIRQQVFPNLPHNY